MIIVIWIRNEENRRLVLNRAVQDVVRILENDRQRNGLAIHTALLSIVTDEAALVAKPFAYAEVTARVDYWRLDSAA